MGWDARGQLCVIMNNVAVAQLLLSRLRLSSMAFMETQLNGRPGASGGRAGSTRGVQRASVESLELSLAGEQVNQVGLPVPARPSVSWLIVCVAVAPGWGRGQVFLRAGDGLESVSGALVEVLAGLVSHSPRRGALAQYASHSRRPG
jgi:hypothetical protein